jgi:GntR family transcriptional regulator, transcriptional repressor for pyruvate dehydrogenase complex
VRDYTKGRHAGLQVLGPQITKVTVSDEVIVRFKDLISKGVFRPGCKLPPERELVDVLGISRPTLRQALRALQILGVIQSRQGSGSYIAESPSEMLKAPLDFALALKQVATTDLFETRKALETKLAELAAQRRTDEDLLEMRQALSDMERSMGVPDDWCRYEMMFHDGIVRAAKNAVMATIMEMLSHLLLESRRQTIQLLTDYPKSYQSHLNIFLAIEKSNAGAASRAMIEHFAVMDSRLYGDHSKPGATQPSEADQIVPQSRISFLDSD